MIERREFGKAGLSALTLGVMGTAVLGAEHQHDETLEKCAEACTDCQRECDACAQHCAVMLGSGKKEHMATLQSCQDCADICTAAARIVARSGAFTKIICMACAEACAKCGAECEKFSADKMMAECAKECRACEKACRNMVKA